jgi:hypothetical protein
MCDLSSSTSSLQPESDRDRELPELDLCRALDTDGAELFLLLPRAEFECCLRLLPPGENRTESRVSTPTTEPVTIGLFLEKSQIHNCINAWSITPVNRVTPSKHCSVNVSVILGMSGERPLTPIPCR